MLIKKNPFSLVFLSFVAFVKEILFRDRETERKTDRPRKRYIRINVMMYVQREVDIFCERERIKRVNLRMKNK